MDERLSINKLGRGTLIEFCFVPPLPEKRKIMEILRLWETRQSNN